MCGSAIRKLTDFRSSKKGGNFLAQFSGVPAPIARKLDKPYTDSLTHDFPTEGEIATENQAKLDAETAATQAAATDAYNQNLLGKKKRRAGSSLLTGAQSNSSLLSSNNFGASSLGG